jgi:hypothetical protein
MTPGAYSKAQLVEAGLTEMGGVGIGKPGDGIRVLLQPIRREIKNISRAL